MPLSPLILLCVCRWCCTRPMELPIHGSLHILVDPVIRLVMKYPRQGWAKFVDRRDGDYIEERNKRYTLVKYLRARLIRSASRWLRGKLWCSKWETLIHSRLASVSSYLHCVGTRLIAVCSVIITARSRFVSSPLGYDPGLEPFGRSFSLGRSFHG